MNHAVNNIASATTGTTTMTLFSYIASAIAKENFSEPEHLKTMIHRLLPQLSTKQARIAGWAGHYAVGLVFMLVYHELWKAGRIKKKFGTGLLLGGISGAVAVAIWKATFKAHPSPPKTHFTGYYAQLVPAHVVFAVTALLTSKYLQKISETK